MAHHKQELTDWRGGRRRSRLVSLETWHVTNEDSLPGREEEGGVGWQAWKHGTSQTRTHFLEGRKEEERGLVSLETWHVTRGLTFWRGGRRSGLVSLEAWHVTNEDSLPREEEEGGVGW